MQTAIIIGVTSAIAVAVTVIIGKKERRHIGSCGKANS